MLKSRGQILTLSSFKSKFKYFSVFILLGLYGLGAYTLGYFSVASKISNDLVKGTSTKADFEQPIESPLPYADVQGARIIPSSVKLCSNTYSSFELSYPKDWFTTYNSDRQQCAYFASYSFVVPASEDTDFVPVTIKTIPQEEWAATVKLYENPNDLQNVVRTENLTIDGRSVEKIEAASTGKGAIPRGYVKVSYLIFNSKTPLILTYQQLDEKEDTKSYQMALRDMAESLKLY